jgi:glyoxylase-like metal-dependent hydrolase (beta-lactamase superfamily II)
MLSSAELGEPLAGFAKQAFGAFRFDDITPRYPTRTFDGRLDLDVGGRLVELIEVGPAHTRGDVLVRVPDANTVFAGDILFIGVTPIIWSGPIANWIAACDRITAFGAETIVPGHGPVTDAEGVNGVRAYLEWIRDEATRRFEEGMPAAEAALDIDLGHFANWVDSERIVVNVDTIYRELDPSRERSTIGALVVQSGAGRDRRARLDHTRLGLHIGSRGEHTVHNGCAKPSAGLGKPVRRREDDGHSR